MLNLCYMAVKFGVCWECIANELCY